MIKTEFQFEGTNVIAYARTTNAYGLENMVIKFVNEDGDRICPRFTPRQRDEITELAMECLQNEECEAELRFE